MNEKLGLIACSNYIKELQSLVHNEKYNDIVISAFPAVCPIICHKDKQECSRLVNNLATKTSSIKIISHQICTEADSRTEKEHNNPYAKISNCLEFLAPKGIIDQFITEGYYIVSSGWLANWKHFVQTGWKFDEVTAKMFFKESAREILLLDTGSYQNIRKYLTEFSDFVGLPTKVYNIGNEYFRNYVDNIILLWRLENEQKARNKCVSEKNKQISEYGMAFDLIPTLAKTTSEEAVIQNVFDIIMMLFAPARVFYASIENQQITSFRSINCDSIDNSLIFNLFNFQPDYAITDSGKGFKLKIAYNDEVFGYLLIDEVLFPEFIQQYTKLINTLISILGLVIANARQYSQLLKAKEKAEESDHLKSAFLANMSHEIRTPMNAIIGFTQLLAKPNITAERQANYLKIINQSGNYLLSLINDIIDVSKIEANLLEISETECYINSIMNDVFSTIQGLVTTQNKTEVTLSYHCGLENGSDKVITDPLRLKQILINLVNNAIKFTHNGSVEFQYSLQKTKTYLHFG